MRTISILVAVCAIVWALAGCEIIRKPKQVETVVSAEPMPRSRSMLVTATAYNAVGKQTDSTPHITASGHRLVKGDRVVAVSPDLLALGLSHGTKIRIEGLQGSYLVLDTMPKKWKRRIDIFMDGNVSDAKAWGKRKVNIFWEE